MYERFFGFRERPFDLTPNPRFLVLTEAHREVLSNLEYGITSRKGVTLALGEPGSGKTTLIRTVLQRQSDQVHSVHLSNPTLSRDEFVEMLAARFGLSDAARRSKTMMLTELEALLVARRERGEFSVLIVDEAQSAPLELLEEIRLLANIEADDQKLLSVILAGHPELAARLDDPGLRQLKQRVALRCELRPLTLRETLGYVAGRIAAAGGVGAQVFTREAVSIIHQASAGLPRTISVIADNALLGGFAAGQRPVSSVTVRQVCHDFGFPVAAETPVTAPAASPTPVPVQAPAPAPSRLDRAAPSGSSIFNLQTDHRRPEPPVPADTAGDPPATPAAKSSGWLASLAGRRRSGR